MLVKPPSLHPKENSGGKFSLLYLVMSVVQFRCFIFGTTVKMRVCLLAAEDSFVQFLFAYCIATSLANLVISYWHFCENAHPI